MINTVKLMIPLLVMTLIGCGENNEKSSASKVITDKVVTTDFLDLLEGTFKSPAGKLTFEENQKISLITWDYLRSSKNDYKQDYYLVCQFERQGSYEITQNSRTLETNLVIKPEKVKVIDARFERKNYGTYFEVTKENKEVILSLCKEYSQEEEKKEIKTRLLSNSDKHFHFHYTNSFYEYDYEKDKYISSAILGGDDFSYFFVKNDEMNITDMIGTIYTGKFERKDEYVNHEISLELKNDNRIYYEYTSDKCSSQGSFEVFFTAVSGAEVRLQGDDPCVNQDNELSISDIAYSKSDSYIWLTTPFGQFFKIIYQVRTLRNQ